LVFIILFLIVVSSYSQFLVQANCFVFVGKQ